MGMKRLDIRALEDAAGGSRDGEELRKGRNGGLENEIHAPDVRGRERLDGRGAHGLHDRVDGHLRRARRPGKYLASSPLQSVTTAATVRVRDGQALITDGPFAETTEQLGGYYVLDLEHLDEAIAVATQAPARDEGHRRDPPALSARRSAAGTAAPGRRGGGSGTPFMLLCYDDEAAWRAAGPEALTGGHGGGERPSPGSLATRAAT